MNARYSYQGKESDVPTEELERTFEEMSLEYQLSNINQAKSFSRYLDVLGCFYTDRPVDYEMITRLRMHKLAMEGEPAQAEIFAHYEALPLEEREKDYEPFNSMLKLIKKYDGPALFLANGDEAIYEL